MNHKILHCENDPDVIWKQCKDHLLNSQLVSFPTETVYGLGANALDEKAVQKIFLAKQRPLTDPVIVHVLGWDHVEELDLYDTAKQKNMDIIKHLAKTFWPGPLTIICRANMDVIPECITAKSGFVGLRSPSHAIARKLIMTSGLPIAAPSANRFGHVSPTTAEHVAEDLGNTPFPILILKSNVPSCTIGIESTVVKVGDQSVDILRRGGISQEKLTECLKDFSIKVMEKKSVVKNETSKILVSPGQMITHYAPDIPTYMIATQDSEKFQSSNVNIKDCVLIDYGKQLQKWKEHALKYFDLSPEESMEEASQRLFHILRLAEKLEDAKLIVVCNLKDTKELGLACYDRLYRACSGNLCKIVKDIVYIEKFGSY